MTAELSMNMYSKIPIGILIEKKENKSDNRERKLKAKQFCIEYDSI